METLAPRAFIPINFLLPSTICFSALDECWPYKGDSTEPGKCRGNVYDKDFFIRFFGGVGGMVNEQNRS